MNGIVVHEIYCLSMGKKQYVYIDIPIEMHYFYKNSESDVGGWTGESNLALVGSNMPNKHFDSLQDAFQKMADRKKRSQETKYLYGIVIDFKKKRAYYDNDETAKYWLTHMDELTQVDQSIEVADWSIVPT